MGFVNRLKETWSSVVKAAEGQWRPGPYYLPVTHGWLPAGVGESINWWQNGYTPFLAGSQLAIIEACLGAYSQTVATCPGAHWRSSENGGRERVTNSAVSRILKRPNDYQSMSDFLLNAVRQLYSEGNAYALCLRNNRFEIEEIHLMDNRYCRAMIAGDGEVFYALGGNWIVQNRLDPLALVPQRDVLHIKLHCDQLRNPLRGESPLNSAFLEVGTGVAIRSQQYQFYQNQSKPGFVLGTDLGLDKDLVSSLRDRWEEMTTGANVGKTPILTNGIKPLQIPVTSWRDAQLAEIMKLTDQEIAMAFRVPPPIVGLDSRGSYGSAEAMMQSWISTGLGFCLNHVEEAFGLTFELGGQPDDYIEFDTKALLRSAFKDRIEGLSKAVVGGIYTPNEARNEEDLKSVPFGDEPRVQQQVVPLSAAGKIPASPAAPSAPPAPKPGPEPPGSNVDAKRTGRANIMYNRSKQLGRLEQRQISRGNA
jgi:HK97 family phage portal protein